MKINGLKLKQARKKIEMTQAELSDKLNIPREYISYYETGSREMDLETLKRIRNILNTSRYKGGFRITLIKKFTLSYFKK